jgi:hypothetical protein
VDDKAVNEQTNEEILADIAAELEKLGVLGEHTYDGLSWPQKAIIASKLDILDQRVDSLIDWLESNVPEGVDALGLVELQLDVDAKRDSRLGTEE